MRKKIIKIFFVIPLILLSSSVLFSEIDIISKNIIYTGWDKVDVLLNVKKVKVSNDVEYLKLADNEYNSSFGSVFSKWICYAF